MTHVSIIQVNLSPILYVRWGRYDKQRQRSQRLLSLFFFLRKSARHFYQYCELSPSLSITRDIYCFCLQPWDKLSITDFFFHFWWVTLVCEVPASQKCRELNRGMDTEVIESRGTTDEAAHARDRRLHFILFDFYFYGFLLIHLLLMCYKYWFVTNVKWKWHITGFNRTGLSSKLLGFDEFRILFTKPVFFVWHASHWQQTGMYLHMRHQLLAICFAGLTIIFNN